MESIDRYFVALSPTHNFDANLLKRAAALLSTDEYNARLLLAGEMPRIIARYQTREPAAALAKELAALGLDVITGLNSDLCQTSPGVFIARSIQLGAKDIRFQDSSGETLTIGEDDAFLILEGIMPAVVEKREARTGKKLNLPATLLLGGIPVWRKSQPTDNPAGENENFLRFYRRRSPEPIVEIRRREFDYSFLGEKKGFSSTENFKTAIATLRSIFPGAIYDNRLMRSSQEASSTSIPQETLERNSRLIYLFYATSQTDRPKD